MTDEMRGAPKKTDEAWKAEVEREKTKLSDEPVGAAGPEEASFAFFLSTLALQAYAAMGEVEDPATGKREANLAQAKYLIDLLGILEEKTRGNRTEEESALLSQILYETRLRYVEKKGSSQ